MKALVLLFTLCAVTTGLHTHEIKDKNHLLGRSVCIECQTIVEDVYEILKDPRKVEELKVGLEVLCHELGFGFLCPIMIGRIDKIIEHLTPCLKDSHAFCQKLYVCSNAKIKAFHHLALMHARQKGHGEKFALDVLCAECQLATRELQTLIDSKDFQDGVRAFLSKYLCHHTNYEKACVDLLGEYLPQVFQELHYVLQQPKELCEHLKMCQTSIVTFFRKYKENRRVMVKLLSEHVQLL